MIYWLLFIILEIYRNYRIIEIKKERPDYWSSLWFRTFFGILCLVLTYRREFDPLVTGVLQYTPYIVYQLTSFWLLFDLGLNLVRGESVLYKGENSGWLDKLPFEFYFLFKFVALITLFYTIYILR